MKGVETTTETQNSHSLAKNYASFSQHESCPYIGSAYRPLLVMCSGFDSSTRVHCALPLKRFTGNPWTNPSMWPSLCKSSTCSSDRNYYSTSLMTGKVENVPGRWWGGDEFGKVSAFFVRVFEDIDCCLLSGDRAPSQVFLYLNLAQRNVRIS